jgi:hypothetical protein
MNNYLVIFSAHVDSENKKIETIKTLKHLKESNIDVCLSTHSSLYLSELSQYVKYVIYDKNNEFLTLQDYIDNSKYINDVTKYGYPNGKTFTYFGNVSMSIPGSLHSKCALSLLRNGIMISELNNYKWTIYLEYDIKIPKLGFKHFFDYHINKLIDSDKKCFYYETKFDDFNFLWGGPFIFETNSVFNNKKFMRNDWYSNNKNWVKEWNIGFFESVIEYTINNVFSKNEIISEIIQDNFKKFWEANDLSELGKFNCDENFNTINKYLRKTLEIHLYPNIDNKGNKKLFLYCNNRGNININLNKVLVYSDKLLHFNKKNDFINHHTCFFNQIEINELTDNDTMVLTWTASIENEYYTNTESIKISDLESVYNNIMNITFNQ